MSKVRIDKIDENNVVVSLSPEIPVAIANELCKNLTSKGLVEDLVKSTLTKRHFYRAQNKVDDLANQLIKSLSSLCKDDISEKRRRDMAESQGLKYEPGKIVSNVKQSPTGSRSIAIKVPDKINTPRMETFKADSHSSECECEECAIAKSGYGPKGYGQYNAVDNARRKISNVGQIEGIGPNASIKSYSTKPGQMSSKAQSDLISREQIKANKKQPVKKLTPEEIKAQYGSREFKKAWGQHLPLPNAEEQIEKLNNIKNNQSGETAAANQLASMMSNKSMLGNSPLSQPTDEQLFGHLVQSDEMIKNKEKQWQGAAFNWLIEASKPISKKFSSEEEELAYWSGIKISDTDNGQSGY